MKILAALIALAVIAMSAVTIHTVWTYVRPVTLAATRPEFGTHAPNCWHLYDKGLNAEWSACIGARFTQVNNTGTQK